MYIQQRQLTVEVGDNRDKKEEQEEVKEAKKK